MGQDNNAGLADIEAFMRERGVRRGRPAKGRAPQYIRRPYERKAPLPDFERVGARGWYLLSVSLDADYAVRHALEAIGFMPWLVECRVRRPDPKAFGRVLMMPEPAFPGYLLLPIDIENDPWHLIEKDERGTPRDKVERLLRHVGTNRFAQISPDSMIGLRRDVAESGGIVIIEKGACRWKERREEQKVETTFEPNQSVRVVAGKFQGFNGLYLATTSEARIKILLDNASLSPVVVLPEASVMPA